MASRGSLSQLTEHLAMLYLAGACGLLPDTWETSGVALSCVVQVAPVLCAKLCHLAVLLHAQGRC